MSINEKILGSLAVMFLSLGCVPAYFDAMFYATVLWIIGFAIMNVHVFVLTRRKF
ncbi:MAG TPA: hypothetical protein VLU95_06125 [Candidatus Acidoferrum sp.]|nr:hypothetical protein [Candidatus Acidoferrum sp.]